jgi:hypothetical protein
VSEVESPPHGLHKTFARAKPAKIAKKLRDLNPENNTSTASGQYLPVSQTPPSIAAILSKERDFIIIYLIIKILNYPF